MTTATKTDIRIQVLEWVEEQLEMGDSLDDAAETAADRIVRQRQSREFVEEFGKETIRALWTCGNRQARRSASIIIGARRVNIQLVQESILEKLYKVGDEWVRLGDCTGDMCRQAGTFFRSQAEGNFRQSYMFSRLADGLRRQETVRLKFTDEQVRGFLHEFKLE